jgi:CHAD domain-containing protein
MRRLERRAKAGDVEAIHDFRVATRRVRAAFKVFRGAIDPLPAFSWGPDLKWIADLLGRVRNLDAMRNLVADDRDGLPTSVRPSVAAVRRRISVRRRQLFDQALEALKSDRYRNLLDRMGTQRASMPLVATPVGGGSESLYDWSGRLIRKRIRRAQCEAEEETRGLAETENDRLHRLRIRLKQVRYAMEFFETLRPKKYRKAIERLRSLQDRLGEHQDRVAFECHLVEWRDRMRSGNDRAVRQADRIQDWIEFSESARRSCRRRFWKRWARDAKKLL